MPPNSLRPFRAHEVYEFTCPNCGTAISSIIGDGTCPKCGMLYEVGRKPKVKEPAK